MRASDAFSWYMERDPALRSTVVVAAWLDRAPDWDLLVARIDRISRTMPSLRQQVVEAPFRITTPRWTYQRHFDLGWHLRRITAPEPRTRQAVLELARGAAMGAFDKDRPLWELTLVEGMLDGQAALILKFHHSLSDGVGGMRMLAVLFDLQRESPDPGDMPPVPDSETIDLRGMVTGAAIVIGERAASLAWRGAGAALPALWSYLRDPARTIMGAVAMAGSVYRTAGPILDTRSPVMRDRAMKRRLATLDVPLQDLKGAAKAAGGTVNDAFMAAVTGGLRRYHERNGAAVDSLRVVMPINLRAEDDTRWGNMISLQRLTVPVAEPDPAARMRQVHRIAAAARNEPSLPVTDVIAGALNLLPSAYVGSVLKHIDFLASNVPGSPVPIYVAGSKITGFYAFGPTIGSSVNVTLVTYGQTCHIGINVDTAAVPDPEALVECIGEGFAEISALRESGARTAARQVAPGSQRGRAAASRAGRSRATSSHRSGSSATRRAPAAR